MTDITSNEKTVELCLAEKYLPKLEKLRKYHKSEMDRLGYSGNPSGVVEYIIDREYSTYFGGYHDVEDYYTDRKVRVIVKKGNKTTMEDFDWEDFMDWFRVVKANGSCPQDYKYRRFCSTMTIEVADFADIEKFIEVDGPHFILDYMRGFPGLPNKDGTEKFEIEVDWSDDYGEF